MVSYKYNFDIDKLDIVSTADDFYGDFLKLDQTTPQTTVGTFTFPNVNVTNEVKIGTATDDGNLTKHQIYGGFYDVSNPTGFYSSPTYSTAYDLYGCYDNGSYADTTTGSFINDAFYIQVWSYATIGGTRYYTQYASSASSGDFSGNPFQLIVTYGDYGGTVPTDGFVIQIYDYNTGQFYYRDVGMSYGDTVPDFTNYTNSPLFASPTTPVYVPTGISNYYSLKLYSYKTTNGVKVYSATPGSFTDQDPGGQGFNLTAYWDDVSADGYIVYDDYSGYWIDVGNTFSQYVDGSWMGWNSGSPTVTPTPYAQDLIHAYNSTYDFKVKGNGQIVANTPTGTKPFDIQSTTLVDNLNADLLDGLHSSSFVQGVTATLPLSVTGTTTKNVALAWNTTNLQNTANQLNTIQNIHTGATPQFAGLSIIGTSLVRPSIQTSNASTAAERIVALDFVRTATGLRDFSIGVRGDYFGIYSGDGTYTRFVTFDGLNKRMRIGDTAFPTDALEVVGNISASGNVSATGGVLTLNTNSIVKRVDTDSEFVITNKTPYVDVAPYKVNNGAGKCTLSTGVTIGGYAASTFAFTTYGTPTGNFYALWKTGGFGFAYESGQWRVYTNWYAYFTPTFTACDRWVLVMNGGTQPTLYQNGVALTPTYTSLSGSTPTTCTEIMRGGSLTWDEVVFLDNRNFSQSDVTADYNGGNIKYYLPTEANVSRIWHCDEGTGTTIADSKSGDTGTFSGGTPVWTTSTKSLSIDSTQTRNVLSSKDGDLTVFGDTGVTTLGDINVNTEIKGKTFTFSSTADTDLTFNFVGTTNSGVMKWMEDEDYFNFDKGIVAPSITETTPTLLKLDQTTPQMVQFGQPIFEGGIAIDDGTQYIYSSGGTDMDFYVGNGIKTTITETGNVLIGTTTDDTVAKLQVIGSTIVYGTSTFHTGQLPSTSSCGQIFRDDGVRHFGIKWTGTNAYFMDASQDGWNPDNWAEYSVQNPFIDLDFTNTKMMLMPVAGNVLVGTTTDNAVDKLQVAGSIASLGSYPRFKMASDSSTGLVSGMVFDVANGGIADWGVNNAQAGADISNEDTSLAGPLFRMDIRPGVNTWVLQNYKAGDHTQLDGMLEYTFDTFDFSIGKFKVNGANASYTYMHLYGDFNIDTGTIVDTANFHPSIDTNNRILYGIDGTTEMFNWASGVINAPDATTVIDAENRILYASDGTTPALSWLSGNILIGTSIDDTINKLQVEGDTKLYGGITGKITTVNDTYQILITDYTIVGDKSTNFTITLPVAAVGQIFNIKNIGVGIITLEGDSSDTIDGQLNQSIGQWDNITVQCNAANSWVIL